MFNKVYEKILKFLKDYWISLIIIIVASFICLFEFSYVVYTPGGIVPLENRIKLDSLPEIKGSFNMSYVTLRKGTLVNIGLSYLLSNWDLKDKDDITLKDESVGELLKLEKLYMTSSINNATILAYKKANKNLEIKKQINNIIYINDNSKTNLALYDEIIEADSIKVKKLEDLKGVVEKKQENDIVKLKVRRNGNIIDAKAQVFKIGDELKIGVAFLPTYEFDADPKIEIKTKLNESGSSGGLMLSLAIYNSLIKEDITKGKKIVGTGTIDVDGTVGAIDGVKYKILGASKSKADLFICPKENYEEAKRVKNELKLDLKIIAVETFEEALEVLEKL